MPTIIFASNNVNKAREIRGQLPALIQILTLKEAGIFIDIPEPYGTFKENAQEKASVIFGLTGSSCFSEDSGLIVHALNGEPGVKSARYAGEEANDEKNITLLLQNLQQEYDRKAVFHTTICLQHNDAFHFFEGECSGRIITEKKGQSGFGYDPVFIPDGSSKTFAEMSMEEKSVFSHRKKATKKLIPFLKEIYGEG